MSNTISAITPTFFEASLNGEIVKVFNCKFLALQNQEDDAKKKIMSAIKKFESIDEQPVYFMEYPWKKSYSKGAVVHKVKNGSEFDGILHENDMNGFEIVGTILKNKKVVLIETDLVAVEKLRRKKESESMKKGNLTIIFSENADDCKNPDKYLDFLEKRDQSFSEYITRGHGL